MYIVRWVQQDYTAITSKSLNGKSIQTTCKGQQKRQMDEVQSELYQIRTIEMNFNHCLTGDGQNSEITFVCDVLE